MYALNEQQIDYILNDIKDRGVEMEDLQLNLLDHICCIIECEMQPDENFQAFYRQLVPRFFKRELKEIEEETVLLLTFKNYYTMRKTMIISGVISVIFFLTGSFFKTMHWPGASMLLTLGVALLSFMFLPLMFLLKTRDTAPLRDKIVTGIGTLIGMLVSCFILFKVMHWPGANTLGITFMATLFFIFIPVYFFTGIRKPEARLNTIVTSIILVAATGLQFTLINVHPAKKQTEIKMYTYLHSEELLGRMKAKNGLPKDALAADIDATADKLKKLVLENTVGKPYVPKSFEDSTYVEDGGVGPAFEQGNSGALLFSHLGQSIKNYNASRAATEQIPESHFQESGIVYYNNFVMLDYLVQTQLFLVSGPAQTAMK